MKTKIALILSFFFLIACGNIPGPTNQPIYPDMAVPRLQLLTSKPKPIYYDLLLRTSCAKQEIENFPSKCTPIIRLTPVGCVVKSRKFYSYGFVASGDINYQEDTYKDISFYKGEHAGGEIAFTKFYYFDELAYQDVVKSYAEDSQCSSTTSTIPIKILTVTIPREIKIEELEDFPGG